MKDQVAEETAIHTKKNKDWCPVVQAKRAQ
jgi:hypothetical protein